MANRLNSELKGKVVVLKKEAMAPAYQDLQYRYFRCEGGFGLYPGTMGYAIFGTYISDGEETRVEGYELERLATDEELAAMAEKLGALPALKE